MTQGKQGNNIKFTKWSRHSFRHKAKGSFYVGHSLVLIQRVGYVRYSSTGYTLKTVYGRFDTWDKVMLVKGIQDTSYKWGRRAGLMDMATKETGT